MERNSDSSRFVVNTAAELRQHEHKKLELADLIRSAAHLASDCHANQAFEELRSLLQRLAENQFTLAVVGQFNRGKSTLMNAIIGAERLPVGILPTTTVITKVAYGNPERLLVEYRTHTLPTRAEITKLADFVSESGNPRNQKDVESVELQLNADVLRYGYYFVDTPGVGSANAENTETTRRFLREADAVIFVTSFDAPISTEEMRLLELIDSLVPTSFIVINKRDLVGTEQEESVLNYTREVFQRIGWPEAPNLFPVSARQALQARLGTNAASQNQSGIEPLEQELIRLLVERKGQALLESLGSRAFTIASRLQVSSDSVDRRDRVVRALQAYVQRKGETQNGQPVSTISSEVETGLPLAASPTAMCAICARVSRMIFDFLSSFQYDITHSLQVRNDHVKRGGFCPAHTWQYETVASPQGVSTGYSPLVRETSERLNELAQSPARDISQRVSEFVSSANCHACEVQRNAEALMIESVIGLAAESMPALCLRHLASVLVGLPPDKAGIVVSSQAESLKRIAENMERYALKHEAIRRYLTTDDETSAYRVALDRLAGGVRLALPRSVPRFI